MRDADSYDAVVVGSGVCGAVCAWQLAIAGARVLLLEAGAERSDRLALVEELATNGSPYGSDDPTFRAPAPDSVPSYEEYYDVPAPRTFRSGYLRREGGSTWHFLGNVPRFVPNDFRTAKVYGVGRDWPLSYNELEEDYCEAECLMGVSGDHEQWNGLFKGHRSKPFPMHKVWPSYSDRILTPLIEQVRVDGIAMRVMNTPQARNSEPYDGRPACAGNSSCVPLCPIGAKYDATVHVAKAVRAGVELRTRAVVHKLDVEQTGRLIETVRYRDWEGREHQVCGRIVVLAAHAVETPKLLLASACGGLANRSDQVGRNLMDHAQGYGRCLTSSPVFGFRGPPTTSGIDVFRDGEFRGRHAAFRLSLGNDGWGRSESPAKTLAAMIDEKELFGSALRDAARDRLTRMFRISFSTEVLPDSDNRVTLSDKVDGLGIPRPRLTFQVPDYNLQAFEKAKQVIGAIFAGVRGTEIRFSTDWSGAGHVIGTCRMGDDPSTSVVNSHGRSHDHPNLYVLGASVFPTAGTANPTLTALALALRARRSMLKDLGRQADGP